MVHRTLSHLALRLGRLLSNKSLFLIGLCTIQALLLAIAATRISPTPDEFPNLVAGTSYLRTGQFGMYNVNPPLVKCFSALPVAVQGLQLPAYQVTYRRPEFEFGRDFAHMHGLRAEQALMMGRWITALFAVWGTLAVYFLGRVLEMEWEGLVAASLWASSPLVMAYGPLISFDIAAATATTHALIALALWIRQPSLFTGLVAGIAVGFTLSIKTSGVLLLAMFPLLWLTFVTARGLACRSVVVTREKLWLSSATNSAFQLAVFGFAALLFVNSVYRFEGSFRSLESYRFVSKALSSIDSPLIANGNRFDGTWLGRLMVPFPQSFVEGVDSQKVDFENPRKPEYRFGDKQVGGDWRYYLIGYGTKLSVLVIAGWIMGAFTLIRMPIALICLGIVPLGLLLFISSQTGMNSHFRYALMLLGPLLVLSARGWVTVLSYCLQLAPQRALCLGSGVAWIAVSGLWGFPFTHSYANELAGGRFAAAERLGGSAADWYQGWWVAGDWMVQQLQAGRTVMVYDAHYNNSWNLSGKLRLVPIEANDPAPLLDALLVVATTDRQDANQLREQDWVLWLADSVEVYEIVPSHFESLRSRFGERLNWVRLAQKP